MVEATKRKATKKTKAAKKPTTVEKLQEADELLVRIEKAEAACQEAAYDLDNAKEVMRNRKAVYVEKVDTLRRLCRARKEKLPLFDPKPNTEAKGANGEAATVATEDWRKLSVESLDTLPPTILGKLTSSRYATMGDLVDLMREKGDWWHKEISGIGETAKGKISDSMIPFWSAHPQPAEASATASPTTGAAAKDAAKEPAAA